MDIHTFLNTIIKDNQSISFFSIHRDFRPIRPDISLSSHPQNNIEVIQSELQNKFTYSTPLFMFENKISARPKKVDICIGFLYSNNIDVIRTVKDYN